MSDLDTLSITRLRMLLDQLALTPDGPQRTGLLELISDQTPAVLALAEELLVSHDPAHLPFSELGARHLGYRIALPTYGVATGPNGVVTMLQGRLTMVQSAILPSGSSAGRIILKTGEFNSASVPGIPMDSPVTIIGPDLPPDTPTR